MTTLESNRRRMVAILAELATGEGLRPTMVDGVKIGSADRGYPRAPVLYEPSIYIVASGRKTGYLGDRTFVYDPNNYLVLSVPLPFECQTEPGPEGRALGISVRVAPSVVSDLAVRMQSRPGAATVEATGYVEATPLDLAMSDAALRWIHSRYAEPFSVTRMAEEVGMSVSAFHHQFKALTASSPVQYLKSVRLHKARALIVDEGSGAAVAATAVGYESASQFSREFKRFFGASPTEEARRVRAVVAEPSSVEVRASH